MKIELIRVTLKDTKEIWEMQVKAFKELLDKYQDFETNPASEPISNIEIRLKVILYKDALLYFSNQ